MGDGPDVGPEPNGYELRRTILDLREEVRSIGSRVVSTEVYVADKNAAAERAGRAESRIRDLEAKAAKEAEARQAREDDANRIRGQQRFTLAMALLALIMTPVMAFVVNGGLAR